MASSRIYASHMATISKAKNNPNLVLEEADGEAVAVMANSDLRYYMVPPKQYHRMVELLEQLKPAEERSHVQGHFTPSSERLDEITKATELALRSGNFEAGDFVEIEPENDLLQPNQERSHVDGHFIASDDQLEKMADSLGDVLAKGAGDDDAFYELDGQGNSVPANR